MKFFTKSSTVEEIKNSISQTLDKVYDLAQQLGNDEIEEHTSELRVRINEPFLFVIVGEVKAGKSSFINAILNSQEEICKVAPSPMTDTIQQIVFGENRDTIEINPYLKKIYEPHDILKQISIVDTPGTNTIIEHHQEITERFVPGSDLVVFVFEAKNPYRQSSWDFFNYINKDWHKKTIFVLQQKDLVAEDDLKVNIEGVRKYAQERGIENPNIFAVSAKQELEGKSEESGFIPLRAYIEDNIIGQNPTMLKLRNNIESSQTITNKIEEGVDLRKRQYLADKEFRTEIQETIDSVGEKSLNQSHDLIENLILTYDSITSKTYNELSEGFGIVSMLGRSFKSIFKKSDSPKEWLEQIRKNLEFDLNNGLERKLDGGVKEIADTIQLAGVVIQSKITNSKTILNTESDIFSDIAEKRESVLSDLQTSFKQFLNRTENFYDESMLSDTSSVAPNVATGSGIALVGVILAAVTNGAVFDVTGGILTTIGLVFAGATIGLKRGKILKAVRKEIDSGRIHLREELDTILSKYITGIGEKLNSNFSELDKHLASEEMAVKTLTEQISTVRTEFDSEMKDLNNLA